MTLTTTFAYKALKVKKKSKNIIVRQTNGWSYNYIL